MMLAGLQLAGFHVEAGARSFAAYTKAMIDDMGEGIRPYLVQWYQAVLDQPGFDTAGMTPRSEIDNPPAAPAENLADSAKKPSEPEQPAQESQAEPAHAQNISGNIREIAPAFAKGDRVVLPDGQHGAITEVVTLVMTPLLGGAGAHEISSIQVRLDNGTERHAQPRDLSPETSPAPKAVPAPKWRGKPVDPAGLERLIAGGKGKGGNLLDKKLRDKIVEGMADASMDGDTEEEARFAEMYVQLMSGSAMPGGFVADGDL